MNLNKCKKLATAVSLALSLAGVAGTAQSAVTYSFEDDDIDFVYRSGQVVTSGAIQVGDIFVSPFQIPEFTINGVNAIPAGQELTGVGAIQLISCSNVNCAGLGNVFTFGPVADGLNSILALGGTGVTVADGDAGEGAMIAMFFNGTSGAGGDRDLELNRTINAASNCTSLIDCVDQASRGTLFQVDGFRDPDNYWQAASVVSGGGDIGTVLGTDNSILVVGINFGLSTFFQLGGGTVGYRDAGGNLCPTTVDAPDGCVQFRGSATITGGEGLVNGAFAHSDFDATKALVTVPEPGILALLGLGFAGLGFGASRRKNVS